MSTRIDAPFTAEEIQEALKCPDTAKFDKLVSIYLDENEMFKALEPHTMQFLYTDPGVLFTAGIATALYILDSRNRAVEAEAKKNGKKK